jgi:lysophospholipase L1-like esterase
MKAHRPATVAVNLALALSVTVLGLGGIELWFRHRQAPRPLFRLDGEVGWLHRPDLRMPNPVEGTTVIVETDARGMRPPFHSAPSDKPRILLLGDSFTDGLEVETADHFAVRVQQRRPDLEIHNAGVSAYSTLQELLLARRLEPRVRPLARVLLVYANDVNENVSPYMPLLAPRPWIDIDGRQQPVEWDVFASSLPPIPFAAWLHRHSVAFFRLETAWARWQRPVLAKRAWSWANRWATDARWAVLRNLVAELQAMGPLLLVACPSRGEVSRGPAETSTRVTAIGTALGIPVLDLRPLLGPEDYWRWDIHWNAAGHRVLADALTPALDTLFGQAPPVAHDRP